MQRVHERHRQKVVALAEQLRAMLAAGKPVRISKGGVSHFVPLPDDPRLRHRSLDIAGLTEILEMKPVRFLLGKFVLGSTNLIAWSKRLDKVLQLKRRPSVVCDYFIPYRHFGDFFQWYAANLDYFPLWVVPYRVPKPYPWVSSSYARGMGSDLLVDCAVYGMPNNGADIDYSDVLEQKTFEFNGIKTLISRNHYTPNRFWDIYHHDNYQQAKRGLDPGGTFLGLYEKLGRRG